LNDIIQFLLGLVEKYGYFGAFIGSILGNITIALPTPYAFLITALGSNLNPFILGIVSGFGATLGELASYWMGLASRKALNPQQLDRLDIVKRLVEKYGSLIIVLFAVTPLPDDLLLVPLGMMGYEAEKMVVSVWAGKTVLALVLAYAGFYGVEYLSFLFESMGWTGVLVSLLFLVVIIVALLRIDWEKMLEKI
jgi:membrane protein YqaA with SNARE-associated domain